jgi:hypothetical protein
VALAGAVADLVAATVIRAVVAVALVVVQIAQVVATVRVVEVALAVLAARAKPSSNAPGLLLFFSGGLFVARSAISQCFDLAF